ncbi:YveK family protein [Pelotomaculum propionicicum]|uniref:YveK family protein n=1 Tax=Pelotomaculum propionicicum TaxID=258475 RepID=UPI003B821D17
MDQNSGNRSDAVNKESANAVWRAIRKQKKFVIAVTLVAGLIGFILNFIVAQPVFESSASVLLTQVAGQSSGYTQNYSMDSITSSVPRVPPLSLKTHMGLVADEALMRRVIEDLNLGEQGYTPKKLAGEIKVSSPGENSNVIKVTARSNEPGLAAEVVNSVCGEYGLMLTDINKRLIHNTVQVMLAETEALKADLAKAATADERQRITDTLTTLSSKIYNARIARDIDLGTTGVVLISPALPSPAPVMTNKLLNTALALLLGFGCSALLAFYMKPRSVGQFGSLPNTGSPDHQGHPEQN